MSRIRRRFAALARPLVRSAGVAVASACLAGVAAGQGRTDLKSYEMDAGNPAGRTQTQVNDLRTGRARVNGPDKASNLDALQKVARHRVYRVTYSSYYTLPESGELKPRTGEQNLNTLLNDLDSLLIVPTPARDLDRMTPDQAEYARELGAALDRAVRDVFDKDPPLIIRLNAARLFAVACKSGAPALGESVTAMLTDAYFKDKAGKPAKTPPEVLYYALVAAENFLEARDLSALRSQFVVRHNLPDAKLVKLVEVLEKMVADGPPVAEAAAAATVDAFGRPVTLPEAGKEGEQAGGPAAAAKPDAPPKADVPAKADAAKAPLTAEQVAVVRYYRLAALKALARVRFDTIGGAGGPEARPAYTLAKVAVSDATLALPTTAAEAAEAVVGLAGMAPVVTNSELNLSAWSAALASGAYLFAQPRMADPADRSLLWKITAARMDAALSQLKDSVARSPKLRAAGQAITDLCDIVKADVLPPLVADGQAGANVPRVDRLQQWLQSNAPKEQGKSLYNDSPKYTLTFRGN